jgi:hypothetical protein
VARLIEVRQPQQQDAIGRTFTIAGSGTGFEATVLWRLIESDGDVLGEDGSTGLGRWG